MEAPQIPVATIAERVAVLSRSPFRDQVARILNCAPTDEAIVALAEKNPDRWGQLLAIVARLGGYTEKLEVEGTLVHTVNALSDAELAAKIAAFDQLLATSFDCKLNVDSPKSQ